MIEKLRGHYKAKGYISREDLWLTVSHTSLEDCKNVNDYVEKIKKAKTSLVELTSGLSPLQYFTKIENKGKV